MLLTVNKVINRGFPWKMRNRKDGPRCIAHSPKQNNIDIVNGPRLSRVLIYPSVSDKI